MTGKVVSRFFCAVEFGGFEQRGIKQIRIRHRRINSQKRKNFNHTQYSLRKKRLKMGGLGKRG